MEGYQPTEEDHRGQYFPDAFRDVNVEPAAYFYPHPCCRQPLSSSASSHLSIQIPERVLSPADGFSPASLSTYLHSDYGCTTPTYKKCDVTEIRKEKSRDAARNRRGKENHEFLALSRLLPLPTAITSQLDKASIVRLCISSLKLRAFSIEGHPSWSQPGTRHATIEPGSQLVSIVRPSREAFDATFGSTILQAHDGFVAALSPDGNILYISETVSIYLGLSQVPT
ncbi:hypothetical protein RvY_11166-3 [Ramazzottius varieornatus]|uniref:BHLH domain-containing protein n=1 Tax=Ramazzottius varieornatus TaxID=947166 RepID=A0A1D1VKN6_RAMVA|nr:hypothetical protein RvY_11166-3 [Ramazzottius varieornatus]